MLIGVSFNYTKIHLPPLTNNILIGADKIGNYLNKTTMVLLDLQHGDARFHRPLSSLTKLRSPTGNQEIRFHGN